MVEPPAPPPVPPSAPARSRLAAWARRRSAELRLAVRTTIAGVLAFAVANGLGLPQAWWAVFTAVIVMQASVGASLKMTIDRLIGTLGGGAAGAAVAAALGDRGPVALALAVALALGPLALLSAVRASFRIAPVTAIIVLLGAASQGTDPLLAAGERVIEIALGCVVSLAVALLVLPARAHGLVVTAARDVLASLAGLLPVLRGGLLGPLDGAAVQARLKAARAGLATLEAVADEARRERTSRLTDEPDPEPLVRTLRRLRNGLAVGVRIAQDPLPPPLAAPLAPALDGLAAALSDWLGACGAALAGRAPPPALDGVGAAFAAFAAALAALRGAGVMRDLPGPAVAQAFALDFALEQLHQDLRDLRARTAELARGAADAPANPG